MNAKTIKARRGADKILDVTNYIIRLSDLQADLKTANDLNMQLAPFTHYLGLLRPPPSNGRIF